MSARDSAMPVWPKGNYAIPPAAAPAAGSPAVQTLPAAGNGTGAWRVDWVLWGYPATADTFPGGTLTMACSDPSWSGLSLVIPISSAGTGFLPISLFFPPGASVTFTLSGVTGVVGSVYASAEQQG